MVPSRTWRAGAQAGRSIITLDSDSICGPLCERDLLCQTMYYNNRLKSDKSPNPRWSTLSDSRKSTFSRCCPCSRPTWKWTQIITDIKPRNLVYYSNGEYNYSGPLLPLNNQQICTVLGSAPLATTIAGRDKAGTRAVSLIIP